MRSEVERAAGAALLRDYGNFFKRQRQELSAVGGGEEVYPGAAAVWVEFGAREGASPLELAQSDNTLLTKILGVFTTLCLEVDELKKEANENHFPLLAMCGARVGSCSAREAAVVCRAAAFTLRCQHTLTNMCSQLFQLHRTALINLQGVQLHYILSALTELASVLAALEVQIANGALPRRWAATVGAGLHTRRDRAPEQAAALADAAQDVIARIFADRIFQDALDSLLPLRECLADKNCSGVASEFGQYLKLCIANLDKTTEEGLNTDVLHKCLKANVLFVVNTHLFGNTDKKTFKALVDLNLKAHSIQLYGSCMWFPEQFLQRYVPALCTSYGKLAQVMLKARQGYLATRRASIARDEVALQSACSQWVLTVDKVFQVADIQSNATLIHEKGRILLKGLELAAEMNYFVVSIVNLHQSQGSPLPKSVLMTVLRVAAALKGVEDAIYKNRTVIVNSANMIEHHLVFQAVSSMVSVKKTILSERKLAQERLDEVTCVVVAERAMRGAATRARLVSAAVALALLPPAAAPALATGSLAHLLHKIYTVSQFTDTMRTLCDCSWLFWHRDVIPVYFAQNFTTKSEALQLKYTFRMLEDCGTLLFKIDERLGGNECEEFSESIQRHMEDSVMKPTSQQVETNLRLHLHSHLRLDNANPFLSETIQRSLFVVDNYRLLQVYNSVIPSVEHYLSTMYYNLTTVVLSDRKTYGEMRQMATFKFNLRLVDDELPTQTLEQGLDVLEIMRNIHIFVSKYLYNLNNQIFVEQSSDSKHLNSINIRHVANSIRTHGTGVMNTTVNFTYQFLRNKFFTFSQFMYDEQIKSRLIKDLRNFRDSCTLGEAMYAYKNAERFNKGIRNLGGAEDGRSYLDLFRELISEIGNAMGYVRMIRSGGRHCCAGATVFLPSLDDRTAFKKLCERDNLGPVTLESAENLEHNIENLVNNFTQGTEYFQLLVDVFAPVFRSPKNVHLKNFFMIVPPLMLNFVENMILAKDKMSKKNKAGAAFTDDGFAMGVAYILKLLNQDGDVESLHWFESVWAHTARERASVEQQKARGTLQLRQALALAEKKLDVLEQEFRLLYYSFSSARIFFQ